METQSQKEDRAKTQATLGEVEERVTKVEKMLDEAEARAQAVEKALDEAKDQTLATKEEAHAIEVRASQVAAKAIEAFKSGEEYY